METTAAELTSCQVHALRLLGAYTCQKYDIWILAGRKMAACRADIMSALMGRRVPQSQSGVTALRAAFYQMAHVTRDCLAACERSFIAWAQHNRH